MEPLAPKQRAHLKSLAHSLKPVFQIGKEGVSDAAVAAVEDALRTRELLKIKVQQAAPLAAQDACGALAGRIADVHCVQVIGRTVVLYRRHPTAPEIRL